MAIPAPVSSSSCVAHASQFSVKNKSYYISSTTYAIADEEGSQILFKMKTEGGFLSRTKRTFYDAASGEVLLVMKRKVPCFGKNSWLALDGPDNESQVLFTLRRKRFSWDSSRVLLEGFFPKNKDSPSNPDFSMEAKSWRSEYTVRLSNGTPIAEGLVDGKKTMFGVVSNVKVYPEVDRAFIAALSMIWILEYFSDNGSQVG